MALLSEVQYAVVNLATTGTLVATQGTGVKIRVVSAFLVSTAGQVLTFKSGAGGTAITGPMAIGANGTLVLPMNVGGWFETAGAAVLELNCASQVSGVVNWVSAQ